MVINIAFPFYETLSIRLWSGNDDEIVLLALESLKNNEKIKIKTKTNISFPNRSKYTYWYWWWWNSNHWNFRRNTCLCHHIIHKRLNNNNKNNMLNALDLSCYCVYTARILFGCSMILRSICITDITFCFSLFTLLVCIASYRYTQWESHSVRRFAWKSGCAFLLCVKHESYHIVVVAVDVATTAVVVCCYSSHHAAASGKNIRSHSKQTIRLAKMHSMWWMNERQRALTLSYSLHITLLYKFCMHNSSVMSLMVVWTNWNI